MQQLIRAESQNLQHLEVELGQRALRKMLDEIVELPLPAQRAGDEVGGKRAIAFILQRRPDRGERRRQIDAAGIHVAKRGERGRACGRDHDVLREGRNRAPGWIRLPARNSLAVSGRRPSRCSISRRNTPSPVCTLN